MFVAIAAGGSLASAASASPGALTLTSARAEARASAVQRLDPHDNPYAVVCVSERGQWYVAMIKAIGEWTPPPDGLPCVWPYA